MLRKLLFMFSFIICLLFLTAAPAVLQEGAPPLPGDVIIADLGAPRGLAFDADGNLLVADAGFGGDVETVMAGPEGPSDVHIGLTGSVFSISPDGNATALLSGFPSYAFETETLGIYRAIPHGGSIWLVVSGSAEETFGAYWTDNVVELDATTLATKHIINLHNIEAEDPDGNGFNTNVSDIAWAPDGTMYITDAGGNSLLSWTEEDGLQVVTAWPENPVPTAIEVADNGDLYIGFLGEGLAPGAAKVERWSGGELVETFGGLNAVSDILLVDDTIYAVELVIFGEQGPGPGRVVMVDADGATPIAEGLPAPFGIAMGPDGALYITFGTIPLGPGMTGGVLRLSM
jgi:glucose/arabinose dehydrogenase